MGGEYFHFEKGVKKQKKGGLIAYKWRPDVVKNLNVHFSIFNDRFLKPFKKRDESFKYFTEWGRQRCRVLFSLYRLAFLLVNLR